MASLDFKAKVCKLHGPVRAYRKGTNHILHLILTICTGGLWSIIWIGVGIKFSGWKCPTCGNKV